MIIYRRPWNGSLGRAISLEVPPRGKDAVTCCDTKCQRQVSRTPWDLVLTLYLLCRDGGRSFLWGPAVPES